MFISAVDMMKSEADREYMCVVIEESDKQRIRTAHKHAIELEGLHFAELDYPQEKIRILEREDFEELTEDSYVVPDWARGGDDPLDYYGFIHRATIKPKPAFFDEKIFSFSNQKRAHFTLSKRSLGFVLRIGGKTYHSYQLGLEDLLNNV